MGVPVPLSVLDGMARCTQHAVHKISAWMLKLSSALHR